jgi:hypothetical protein
MLSGAMLALTAEDGDSITPVTGAAAVPVEAAAPHSSLTVQPAPPPQLQRVALPVRVAIPKLGVRARIVPLGLNGDGTLQVPESFADTGWWAGGALPGEPGPAVVAGHVGSPAGQAVFFRLGSLRRGDVIRIARRDGSVVGFAVQRVARYPKTRFPAAQVYGATRRPTLRLITVATAVDSSTDHYLDSTVVYATLLARRRTAG